MVLEVKNLCCARGGINILEGIDFRLEPGNILVLRGPNGSGKTTLLRTIAGLQAAVSGCITGADEAVAYGGHADGLKAMLSVADNLSFWADVYGTGNIADALTTFELGGLQNRLANNLSAGQKRRLGLARLLVTGRSLWVLDEPTVSLDSDSVAMFARAVSGHLEQGGSALIATHIELGIKAETLDVGQFRATSGSASGQFDEAFL